MNPPALRIRDLTVRYGTEPVLWDVDLDVPEGSLTAILGPNGAGKSTLIQAAMELVPKAAGSVRFFGEPLSRSRQRVAYVPQRSAVDWDFPASALDVVLMGIIPRRGWFRWPNREDRDWAAECLALVGMAAMAGRHISELSGGQQQRVFLARALAQQADLLVLDEPFAAVDAETEQELIRILDRHRADGGSALVVHHDLVGARDIFDRALLLNVQALAEGPIQDVLEGSVLARAYRRLSV